jgi:hypothetical protein
MARMPDTDRASENCHKGWHSDPDNSGLCIACGMILDPEPGEDPNAYRRTKGLPDLPAEPV